MSGRKPKPTALRLLEGNAGKPAGHRPLPENEPEVAPPAKLPNAPRYLNAEAKQEWRKMGNRLLDLGLVTDIDTAALSAYCAAYGRHAQAERDLEEDEDGFTITTANGNLIQNPKVGIANRASVLLLKAAVEFGMSPSARTRVAAALPAESDPFDDFLRDHGRVG